MSEQDWSWQDKIPMPSDEDYKKFLDNTDKLCEICKKPTKKGQICKSKKCGNEWWERYIINGLK